jgi:hypothetical protein
VGNILSLRTIHSVRGDGNPRLDLQSRFQSLPTSFQTAHCVDRWYSEVEMSFILNALNNRPTVRLLGTCWMTVTGASILMTIERPGIMTRFEVKTSVKEGRGMLEIPIMCRKQEKSKECKGWPRQKRKMCGRRKKTFRAKKNGLNPYYKVLI